MIFKTLLTAVAVTGFLCAAPAVDAKPKPTRSEMVLVTFTKTCLKYLGRPGEMGAALEPGDGLALPKLPQEAADRFLGGKPGRGWALPYLGEAVLIQRENGPCTIFVRQWPDKDFENELTTFFDDELTIFDLEEINRSEKPLSTVSWKMTPAGNYRDKLESKGMPTTARSAVTLSTGDSEEANFQLALSATMLR